MYISVCLEHIIYDNHVCEQGTMRFEACCLLYTDAAAASAGIKEGIMPIKKSNLKDIMEMIVGSGVMAAAITWFYEPQELVTGGAAGAAIMIKYLTKSVVPGGIPLGISTFVINVPIFLWAWKQKGRQFLLRTLFSTLCLSLWLAILPVYEAQRQDYLISAGAGGILTGVGVGLVFRAKSTTGGADLLAVLLHRHLPHRTVMELLLMLNAAVVLLGFGVFGAMPGMYALIAVYITSRVSDRLTEGLKFAKGAFVITGREHQVAEAVMENLHRGVTAICARGMYSETERGMLYCIVSVKQLIRLKEIVYEIDPQAFITVTDVREVLGKGFEDWKSA